MKILILENFISKDLDNYLLITDLALCGGTH